MADPDSRYLEPGGADKAFNAVAHWLTARGISLMGSRVLAVRVYLSVRHLLDRTSWKRSGPRSPIGASGGLEGIPQRAAN